MNKNKGFTIIELMIVLSILGFIATIVTMGYQGMSLIDGEFGVICKAGYKFSYDTNGYQQQIFDENGRAIPCK